MIEKPGAMERLRDSLVPAPRMGPTIKATWKASAKHTIRACIALAEEMAIAAEVRAKNHETTFGDRKSAMIARGGANELRDYAARLRKVLNEGGGG